MASDKQTKSQSIYKNLLLFSCQASKDGRKREEILFYGKMVCDLFVAYGQYEARR